MRDTTVHKLGLGIAGTYWRISASVQAAYRSQLLSRTKRVRRVGRKLRCAPRRQPMSTRRRFIVSGDQDAAVEFPPVFPPVSDCRGSRRKGVTSAVSVLSPAIASRTSEGGGRRAVAPGARRPRVRRNSRAGVHGPFSL